MASTSQPMIHGRTPRVTMRNRTLSANCGIGVFLVAFLSTVIGFCSPAWMVSDTRLQAQKLDRFGLWVHCFRSLADPLDVEMRRFFVGCRWVYDPFTTGYKDIHDFLLPGFIIATQFFFTLLFIVVLLNFILVAVFFLCSRPDHKRYLLFIQTIGSTLLGGGLSGGLACIIFASMANRKGWMPGQENNFFDWGFGFAVVGALTSVISGALFLVEFHIQSKKKKYLKESQTRFEMESETKA